MSKNAYSATITPPEPGRPLVFAFHGTGGDETQFVDLATTLVPGGGIISPRGDVSEGGAARFFRRTGEGVYDMADLVRATEKMGRFIEAHARQHPDSPVYAFGYSNGANLLASVVMARPELFDRIALLHPLIPWEPEPVPGLAGCRVFISAGQRDPITPWEASARLVAWFTAQGAEVTTSIHGGGHELRQTEIEALAAHLSA